MLSPIENKPTFSWYRENRQPLGWLGALATFFLALNCAARLRGEDDGIYGKWIMTPRYAREGKLIPATGKLAGTIRGAQFSKQSPSALVFDGKQGFLTLADNLIEAQLPRPQLTAEAWVLVQSTSEWGAFASAIQDNGEYERGWMLGYRGARFCFGLVSSKKRRLTYLTANTDFAIGSWYYVAATYDGQTMNLYVDGQLAASSKEQTGDILYPERGRFGLGGYRDDDEFYPLDGRIAEVSVHRQVLSGREITRRFSNRKQDFPGIVASRTVGDDWPTYLRDDLRSGMSTSELQWPLKLAWRYRAKHPPAPAWPPPAKQNFWREEFNLPARVTYDRAMHVVSDGNNVFFGSSADDQLHCLDLSTGATRWVFFAEGPIRLAPTLWKNRVYFGSDDGHVYCLTSQQGRQLWKFRAGPRDRRIPGNGRIISAWPVRSGVIIDDGRIRFAAGLFPNQGTFQYLLDAQTGKQLASGTIAFSPQGYMTKRGNSLAIAQGRGPQVQLAKLQRAGKPLPMPSGKWAEQYPYSFVGAANSWIAGGAEQVAAFDSTSGKQIWRAQVEGRAYGLAVTAGHLLVSTDRGNIYCFAPPAHPRSDPPPEPSQRHGDSSPTGPMSRLAQRLVQSTGADIGYALLLGSGNGRLAGELARRTRLRIICVDPVGKRVDQARQYLADKGHYGQVVVHRGRLSVLPYGSALFNLVIYVAPTGRASVPAAIKKEILRVLHPNSTAVLTDQTGTTWMELHRAALAGTGDWTHMYANPANTSCSLDKRVRDQLQLQWFGPPGPRDMVDRHHRTVPPLVCDGRLFIPGDNRVIGVDAYNGSLLWNVEVADSRRIGALRDAGSMVATEDYLYVLARDRCYGLNARTGASERNFSAPLSADGQLRYWGYVARVGDRLFGSTTRPGASRTEQSRQTIDETYYDHIPIVTSDRLFARQRHSGEPLWDYTPTTGAILNPTITIANNRLFFVQSNIASTLAEESGRSQLPELLKKAATLVAIDATTGQVAWKTNIDLSSIEHHLYLSYAEDRLIAVGTRNQGSGKQGRVWYDIHCYSANDGKPQWNTTQNQQQPTGGSHGEQDHHPVIVGQTVYVEPYAYDLVSGQQLQHWNLRRGGHGCGAMSAS
ncbi:MAG: hypothetical protein CMJ75_02440, partial [Planctomycetaceae bacterium]|nr:hypothetical protein [Planctomycetaceae bacterium]